MNIYWPVLLQFLGDEHIKWFYIVAALQHLDFLRPLPSLRLRDVKDVIWCLPEDSQTPTRPGACEDISLGKEHQPFFFWGYLFSLLSKEKNPFEGGARICLCKVLFRLGWCWGILRAVNMSGPQTLLLLVWGTWLVVNTLAGGGRRSADEEMSYLL